MKRIFLVLLMLFCLQNLYAQNFNGTWQGRLGISAALRIVFYISDSAGTVRVSWQSPDQTKMMLKTDTAFIEGDSIFIRAKMYGVSFRGKLQNDTSINGVFKQGADMTLNLVKNDVLAELKRPQTPKPPFPYNSKEVQFSNPGKTIQFAGTLTWPKKDPGVDYFREPVYPAVVLVTGSGPQDRDESIFGHRPFAVLADALTRKGFAVLRYDERGMGKSTGNFASASTADFADDAEAAFEFLRAQPGVDSNHVGIIGHSEGGMVAPMVAARRDDVQNIVLLAGPGVPIIRLAAEQIEAVGLAAGQDSAEVFAGRDIFIITATEILRTSDTTVLKINMRCAIDRWMANTDTALLRKIDMRTPEQVEKSISGMVREYTGTWFHYFLKFNPSKYLKEVNCNVLAINGAKDMQVLAGSNLAGIKAALKNNKHRVDVIEIPGLNHLFQTCNTCSVTEYAQLEETFSPQALNIITDWLLEYGR